MLKISFRVSVFALFVYAAGAQTASAQLIASDCLGGELVTTQAAGLFADDPSPVFILASSRSGLTCENLIAGVELADHIKLALLPATLVLANPAVGAQLQAGLATLGIGVGSAAVLSVTVIGAVGFVTVYYLLKPQYDECVKEKNLSEIKREIEKTYNLPARGSISIIGGKK